MIYQYYAMDKGAWVDGGEIALDMFEGFKHHNSGDYSTLPEEKVPEVIAKLDARWKKHVETHNCQDEDAPNRDTHRNQVS